MLKMKGKNLVSSLRTIVLLVSLCFVLTIVSADKDIKLDYHRYVELGEEFEVEISLEDFQNGVYAVKLDLLNGEQRVGQILNQGTWKSTYYYVEESLLVPSGKETFRMRIIEPVENAQFIVKIKSESRNIWNFDGGTIYVKSGTKDENEKLEDVPIRTYSVNVSGSTSQFKNESVKKEAVVLTPQAIKTNSSAEVSYSKFWVGLGLIVVIMAVLLLTKKRKH